MGFSAVVTNMGRPNGLAFSPDEKPLYVSDSSRGVRVPRPRPSRDRVGSRLRLRVSRRPTRRRKRPPTDVCERDTPSRHVFSENSDRSPFDAGVFGVPQTPASPDGNREAIPDPIPSGASRPVAHRPGGTAAEAVEDGQQAGVADQQETGGGPAQVGGLAAGVVCRPCNTV